MKSVIMTTALSLNYGAALQTYALARILQQNNVDVEVYKYIDKKRITYGMSLFSIFKYKIWNIMRVFFGSKIKERNFSIFRSTYIPLTNRLFKTNSDLKKFSNDYDLYIAGSDQIWNPDFFRYDLSYFFDFVSDDKRRISYSSSFAKKSFESPYKDQCSLLLQKFDSISVREESGISIVADLAKKDATCVLDPTLLLSVDDWKTIINSSSNKSKRFNGILCYVMPGDKLVVSKIEEIAQKLHQKTGLPIMRLGIKEYNRFKFKRNECDLIAGPIDFVQYFANAQYVVTNSFHGTAFSINFGKKFIVPYNSDLSEKAAIHERILSLLSKVHLEKAFFSCSQTFNYSNMVDAKSGLLFLNAERAKSVEYLLNAVGTKNDRQNH